MCKWGTETELLVPISASVSHTGKFRWDTKKIDSCIAPLVQALNDAGIYTDGCCCGHGQYDGYIGLHNGTMLIIQKVALAKISCVGNQ